MVIDIVRAVQNGLSPKLTPRAIAVLAVCATKQPISPVTIAERLNIPRPSVTRAHQLLTDLGLLVCDVTVTNGRQVSLKVTREGYNLLARIS